MRRPTIPASRCDGEKSRRLLEKLDFGRCVAGHAEGPKISGAMDPLGCHSRRLGHSASAILAGIRVSPYFYNWTMTPIEAAAWQELREQRLPLYPRCPVGNVFIDFGDPVLRIGLELDGKDFHDSERDQVRDTTLWRNHGWRTIRIRGGSCYETIGSPAGGRFRRRRRTKHERLSRRTGLLG
jgi:hypothetical protein